MIEIIGWIGAVLFGICAFPQAYKSWKQKHSRGISDLLLLFWTLGEIFTLIYVSISMDTKQALPLIFNYLANIIALFVIIYYRLFPKLKE